MQHQAHFLSPSEDLIGKAALSSGWASFTLPPSKERNNQTHWDEIYSTKLWKSNARYNSGAKNHLAHILKNLKLKNVKEKWKEHIWLDDLSFLIHPHFKKISTCKSSTQWRKLVQRLFTQWNAKILQLSGAVPLFSYCCKTGSYISYLKGRKISENYRDHF